MTLFEQRVVIKSYLSNSQDLTEDDTLEPKYFDYAYKRLVAEYNSRLKNNKEAIVTLLDEYLVTDSFDIGIFSENILAMPLARRCYKKLKVKSVAIGKVGENEKRGIKLNYSMLYLYEKVILSSYYFQTVKNPIKLNEKFFSSIYEKVARLINKLIDVNKIHLFSTYLDEWAIKYSMVQNDILDMMIAESVEDISFYYKKLQIARWGVR